MFVSSKASALSFFKYGIKLLGNAEGILKNKFQTHSVVNNLNEHGNNIQLSIGLTGCCKNFIEDIA
ncbi:hypothetical protein GCM10007103_11660 [Salinimicrobium marinum]|uniref:Uncharacterized protein n=1 Tax=Salinimicrobium marinum TaxID=680283 RepID=A0A918VX61_9FLAO|nr:hypothetical protein GCM10007103_11660 [Salinimicrobium marinum]